MRDLATPLPVLVTAETTGVPKEDRLYIRQLAEKPLYIGRGDYDRMKPLTEGMRGMIEYVCRYPPAHRRSRRRLHLGAGARREAGRVHPPSGLVITSLLLLAGHETTINLLCNGTLALTRHPDQWELLKQDPAGRAKQATEECLRYNSPVISIQRIATEDVEMRRQGAAQGRSGRLGSSHRRTAIRGTPRMPILSTSSAIRTSTWRLGRARITAWATLARVEGQEVFRALAERFPNLRAETVTLERAEYQLPGAEVAACHLASGAVVARKLKFGVDRDACVGDAMCGAIAPRVFRLTRNANRRRSTRLATARRNWRRQRPVGQRDLRGGCGDRERSSVARSAGEYREQRRARIGPPLLHPDVSEMARTRPRRLF